MTGVLQDPISLLLSWLTFSTVTNSPGGIGARRTSLPVPHEDHALMEAIASGDAKAFEELFDKWKRPLISFFFRSLGDYHWSEDLTLEVALKVYRASKAYQPKAKFSTWLFQIAYNCLRDALRKKRPAFLEGTVNDPAQWVYPELADATQDAQIEAWEEWLMRALDSVPESEKTALLLITQQGMTPSEAADVMQISPNHVRVLLNKVRNRLREIRENVL